MDQVKIGKFISNERKAKGIHRNNYLNCWQSVIKQYRNGSVETAFRKHHCCYHCVMN